MVTRVQEWTVEAISEELLQFSNSGRGGGGRGANSKDFKAEKKMFWDSRDGAIQDEVSLGLAWVAEPQWCFQGPVFSAFPGVLDSQLQPGTQTTLSELRFSFGAGESRAAPKPGLLMKQPLHREFLQTTPEKSWEELVDWPTLSQCLPSKLTAGFWLARPCNWWPAL